MQAQRIILRTDGEGKLIEQPVLPANATLEVIFLIDAPNTEYSTKQPSQRLEKSFRVQDDLIQSTPPPEEWEASLERTCRQLESDENNFKKKNKM